MAPTLNLRLDPPPVTMQQQQNFIFQLTHNTQYALTLASLTRSRLNSTDQVMIGMTHWVLPRVVAANHTLVLVFERHLVGALESPAEHALEHE